MICLCGGYVAMWLCGSLLRKTKYISANNQASRSKLSRTRSSRPIRKLVFATPYLVKMGTAIQGRRITTSSSSQQRIVSLLRNKIIVHTDWDRKYWSWEWDWPTDRIEHNATLSSFIEKGEEAQTGSHGLVPDCVAVRLRGDIRKMAL